jgi:SAM-dependent methyltransferase
MNAQWEPYQKRFWTETWESSPYSIPDLIDKDPFVGVKFSPLLPHIVNSLKKDDKIIEAGCGMGQWVIYLSDCGYDITGLDFSEPVVEKLQILYPEKKFLIGDITKFEFQDNTFDAMLSWGVVEHFIEGPSVPLKEANRILKNEGILFITVPCNNILSIILSPLFFVRACIGKLYRKISGTIKRELPFYQYTFKKAEFINYLTESGFICKKVIPISHEVRFASLINSLLKIKKEKYSFYKNKGGKWQGLTNSGKVLCSILKKINPWLTPDQIFVIAQKV